ncbi:MAG: hypothetical protein J0J01_15320 [Reyranella sp.]|uniref:hypothetical protein n=1 Tax=Reyranella sp. TaxID=1929291 RepID=UPI001AC8C325|nr:hypothetical protein [Reyranella sp.]MBN9088278.1 hypothetical protein [Reyranella sp.]
MNGKFDISIPILVVLAIVAAWQFYGLAWGGPKISYSAAEIAVTPSTTLRVSDPVSD